MTPIYQLTQLKVFRGQKCTLTIPELTIMHDSSIALLGDNGAGKSTLLNCLAFIEAPSEGRITLDGQVITKQINQQQRRKIGYVNQQPFLLSGTIKDNIILALKLQGIPKQEHDARIEQALSRLI